MDFKGMLIQQHAAIKANLAELTAAVGGYSEGFDKFAASDDPAAMGALSSHNINMIEIVKQMQSAVYGPINMFTLHFEEFFRSGSLRALVEMGVIDALPSNGSGMPAKEPTEKLKVDEVLLIRLMRMVVPTFFGENSPEIYSHTPNFMVCQFPPLRGAFKMMYDEFGPASFKLTEYFSKTGYKNPNLLTDNPYTYAHDTKGLNMFESLAQDPVRFKNFNDAMQYDTLPFKAELTKTETTEDSVLLVDIGGVSVTGIKGKLILQDQVQVLEGVTELPSKVEKMAYDFFTPQPIKGAKYYYVRRCLHDWPEDPCVTILKNGSAAIIPGTSRLLISEIVLPLC